jgi:hypothetical protein
VPDLARVSFEIIAFIFLAFKQSTLELLEMAWEWSRKHANIIFASDCEDLGMNSIIVSVHKNHASFSKLITTLRQDWQPSLKDVQSFILSVNTSELAVKPFSVQYLERADV